MKARIWNNKTYSIVNGIDKDLGLKALKWEMYDNEAPIKDNADRTIFDRDYLEVAKPTGESIIYVAKECPITHKWYAMGVSKTCSRNGLMCIHSCKQIDLEKLIQDTNAEVIGNEVQNNLVK